MRKTDFLHPDLHLHSSFSDGTDSPEELLNALRQTEVDIFSLTDHDTIAGCLAVKQYLSHQDPVFLPGVEFSCEDAKGRYHILGYAFSKDNPAIENQLAFTHNIRIEKAKRRFSFLEKERGLSFSQPEKELVLKAHNPGKPHFVSLMLQKGIISRPEDGYALFKGEGEQDDWIDPEKVVQAILSAQGIPVLAHGILGDGTTPLSQGEIRDRIIRLKEYGLMGAECFYSSFSKAQSHTMLSLAYEYDLLITAGSDYHGKNKCSFLGQTGLDMPQYLYPFYHRALERLSEEAQ